MSGQTCVHRHPRRHTVRLSCGFIIERYLTRLLNFFFQRSQWRICVAILKTMTSRDLSPLCLRACQLLVVFLLVWYSFEVLVICAVHCLGVTRDTGSRNLQNSFVRSPTTLEPKQYAVYLKRGKYPIILRRIELRRLCDKRIAQSLVVLCSLFLCGPHYTVSCHILSYL